MKKIKTLIFTCLYLAFLWFMPWNFFCFFAGITLGWFLLLAWLPFNDKNLPTPFGIKVILLVMQITFMLILSFVLWRLIPVFIPKQDINNSPQETEAVSTQAPALSKEESFDNTLPEVIEFSDPRSLQVVPSQSEPAKEELALPMTQEGVLIKEQLFPTRSPKAAEPVRAQAALAQHPPVSELEKHPAYNQVFTKVNQQIQQEDRADVAQVIPASKMKTLNKIPSFMRGSVMLQFVQAGIEHNTQLLKNASENGLSPQDIAAIKKQLFLQKKVLNKLQQRHAPGYLEQAIEEELQKYTNMATPQPATPK